MAPARQRLLLATFYVVSACLASIYACLACNILGRSGAMRHRCIEQTTEVTAAASILTIRARKTGTGTMPIPKEIHGQKYLCLITFRKSRVPVNTPVWFAERDDKLYVKTRIDSGKAKRIRNNLNVKVASSTMRGKNHRSGICCQGTNSSSGTMEAGARSYEPQILVGTVILLEQEERISRNRDQRLRSDAILVNGAVAGPNLPQFAHDC